MYIGGSPADRGAARLRLTGPGHAKGTLQLSAGSLVLQLAGLPEGPAGARVLALLPEELHGLPVDWQLGAGQGRSDEPPLAGHATIAFGPVAGEPFELPATAGPIRVGFDE